MFYVVNKQDKLIVDLSLKDLIKRLVASNSNIKEVVGHCDIQDNKKDCTGFNLKEWLFKEDINVA